MEDFQRLQDSDAPLVSNPVPKDEISLPASKAEPFAATTAEPPPNPPPPSHKAIVLTFDQGTREVCRGDSAIRFNSKARKTPGRFCSYSTVTGGITRAEKVLITHGQNRVTTSQQRAS